MKFLFDTKARSFYRINANLHFAKCLFLFNCIQLLLITANDENWLSEAASFSISQS